MSTQIRKLMLVVAGVVIVSTAAVSTVHGSGWTNDQHAILGADWLTHPLPRAVLTRSDGVSQTDIEEKNRRAVQAAFDNWRRAAGTAFDLLASDAKWTIANSSTISGTYHSRRDFMDQVVTPFNSRLQTPLVPTVRGLYADGDTVIVLWDGAAIARDGKQYENTYSWYLKMRDGKIVNAVAVYDSAAFDDLWKRIRPVY